MELCINNFVKMLPIYIYIIYCIINTEAKISSVGAKTVTKRDTDVSGLFLSDFLPFKKNAEDVGQLKQVTKNKVKKRLAPPMNFMLRAVEPEGDDYYDKAQGDSDNDDYYEKKEWSEVTRLADAEDKEKLVSVNHTDISDIDGVVSIIVGRPDSLLKPKKPKVHIAKLREKSINPTYEETRPKTIPQTIKKQKYEDEADYEESNSEKHKPGSVEYEQSENEAKKTVLLDSIDELKDRHAKEQKIINEKIKEEEMDIEEQERDKIHANIFTGERDKYDEGKPKNKKHLSEYDEYEENTDFSEEKVKTTPARRQRPTTTTPLPIRTSKRKGKKDKQIETGKLSVFKNPQLFVIYDEDLEETTPNVIPKERPKETPTTARNSKQVKYSSTYTSTPVNTEGNERISLLPAETDGKEGEPTLFFPRKRKNKKRNKSRTTSRPTDSIVAETIPANRTNHLTTALTTDTTTNTADTTAENTIVTDTTAITEPTGTDFVPTHTEPVTDALAASTDHKAEAKTEDYHREKGGMKEYRSSHEEEHNEEGKKAYEGVHEETKTAKGHHDKEAHHGKYHDDGGMDKYHEEEMGHYGLHSHEEHGKKHAKYEESGKHAKGHNTKGSHDIHKKEEYEKKVEFFEEEGDSAEEEKHGGYEQEKEHKEGGQYKKGNYNAGHEAHHKGESGFNTHGGLLHVSKGHKVAEGHDTHGKHDSAHGSKGGKGSGRKWIYHHGHPAKTANLVRIDRRAEKYYHGPQYFG